jgi:hypothetical protein
VNERNLEINTNRASSTYFERVKTRGIDSHGVFLWNTSPLARGESDWSGAETDPPTPQSEVHRASPSNARSFVGGSVNSK